MEDQLKTRKYMSWQILLISYALTAVFTILQLSNIYPTMTVGYKLLPVFVLFLVVLLGSLLIYVVKSINTKYALKQI